MLLKQSIDWKNEWFPIDDATYLNFAAHAAIPRVALNASGYPPKQRCARISSMTKPSSPLPRVCGIRSLCK